MAPIKRPAVATAGAGKRAKKEDPVLSKCAIVEAALDEATFMPESCRTMLAAMVGNTLTTVKEERHPYQVSIVEKLGEVLVGIQAKIRKDLADAQAEADGIDGMKKARQAAVVEAEKALTALEQETVSCKAALEEAKTAGSAAKAANASAKKVQSESDKVLDKLAAKKTALEAAKGSDLVTMSAADASDKDMKAALKNLVKLGKEHNFDSAMLEALPTVLKKAPAERGAFSAIIIKQLEEEFETAVSGLAKEIEDGEPGKAERAAAMVTTEEAEVAAASKVEECGAALAAAKAAEKAGATALEAAKETLASYIPDVKKVLDTYDELSAALPAFTEGPLTIFGELKELMPPPPPVEEPAAEEAVPEEMATEETVAAEVGA